MDLVVHDDNLRRIIFSYLKKKPLYRCTICNNICMWNNKKKILDFVILYYSCICFDCIRKLYKVNSR